MAKLHYSEVTVIKKSKKDTLYKKLFYISLIFNILQIVSIVLLKFL